MRSSRFSVIYRLTERCGWNKWQQQSRYLIRSKNMPGPVDLKKYIYIFFNCIQKSGGMHLPYARRWRRWTASSGWFYPPPRPLRSAASCRVSPSLRSSRSHKENIYRNYRGGVWRQRASDFNPAPRRTSPWRVPHWMVMMLMVVVRPRRIQVPSESRGWAYRNRPARGAHGCVRLIAGLYIQVLSLRFAWHKLS